MNKLIALLQRIADDIHGNRAYSDRATEAHPAFWAAVWQENKQSIFGIGLLVRENGLARG